MTSRTAPGRISAVIVDCNTVPNAIKFTDAGEVTIKASAQNGTFTIAVVEMGPGIAPADQARIFMVLCNDALPCPQSHQGRARLATRSPRTSIGA